MSSDWYSNASVLACPGTQTSAATISGHGKSATDTVHGHHLGHLRRPPTRRQWRGHRLVHLATATATATATVSE
ncbi:hypothetical protein L596_014666 [Steinernema carpocapsae]|uniref:Uncharacterized protein n=1 Tax=Steinernema carpocapsae TaxID=34508 RepID=A0A4U5NCS0_STECR|nr:hypothetical protein L596_014666 [Steinernema carpocapsae]